MKLLKLQCFFIILGFCSPLWKANPENLDTGFGRDGIVTTDIGENDQASSLAIDSSGKIVVAGSTQNGDDYDITVVKYKSDGDLDPTFGNSGVAITNIDLHDTVSSVVIDDAGNIVVAGFTSGSDYLSSIFLIRYTSSGNLDESFGEKGIVTTSIATNAHASSLAIDKSGNIIVAGHTYNGSDSDFTVARYTSSGALDLNFGDGDGIVITNIDEYDEATSLALDTSGNIILVGSGFASPEPEYFALVRYTSSGALDTNFGHNGIVTNSDTRDYLARSIALDTSGKIIVAGYTSTDTHTDFAVARYTPTGALDTAIVAGGSGGGGCQFTTISGSITSFSSFIFMLPLLLIMVLRMKKSGA